MAEGPNSALPRRSFLKAAVATGGAAALSACLNRLQETQADPVPHGVKNENSLPVRQHAWRDVIRKDTHGNSLLPNHQILLYLTLKTAGPPGSNARRTVETALSTLDRAYERSNRGLLFSAAYSPTYFDRFDEPLPDAIDLPPPRALSPFEHPTLDTQDMLLHFASDRADVVLEAEEALIGDRDRANGVPVEVGLSGILSVDSRRTGFVGAGMPAERQDVKGIPGSKPVPDAAPLFMGFKAGFERNQATEEYVTLDEGPFAGGTTKHVAKLRQRLDDWYVEQDFEDRVAELFSPTHARRGLVEGVGDNLGDDSGVTAEIVERIETDAREYGRVGHAQKAARASRDDEGNVRLLRRHIESTDDDEAGLHFPSLQRGISDFEAVQRAMNGMDVVRKTPTISPRVNNGILEYIFVQNRGNFLVPPRPYRSLPHPRPDEQ
ncbi:DUF7405 family protein [Halegenticoccus tardaugens]|uniref:DUF7405 family protein n=1 Tax=Halegenticoccus tardaugens TaxID=2071624 RepID=UPI00100ACD8D|nr:twin-arginine translocation signal domain-containing protein [Halegenticoccus tardaugens]